MSLKRKILKLFKENAILQDGCVMTIFLFLAILFFKNILFSNQLIYGWDIVHEYYYWRNWAFGLLSKGCLPLWNPYVLSGYPFFADPQQAIFYPLNFIFLILPTHLAINYCIFLHILLAGIFMYFYMRELNVDKFSSFMSGIVFMYNGFIIGRIFLGSLPQLCTLVWLPLLFLLIEKGIEKNSIYIFLLAGLISGLQILAGHLQYYFYALLAICIYFLFKIYLILRNKEYQRAAKLSCFFLLTIITGFLLAAIQIIPSLYLIMNSDRGQMLSFHQVTVHSFPPEGFITSIAPDFMGNEITTFYWGRSILNLIYIYIGILPLIFILMNLFFNRNKFTFFFLALSILSLLLAMGKYTPIFTIVYKYMPTFNSFRLLSRWLFIFVFSMSVLSGLGCNFFLKTSNIERKKLLRFYKVISGCILTLFFIIIFVTYSGEMGRRIWKFFADTILNPGDRIMPAFKINNLYDDKFLAEIFLNAKRSLNRFFILIATSLFFLFFYTKNKFNLKQIKIIIIAIILLDLFSFGRKFIINFEVEKLKFKPEILKFFDKNLGNYRIATLMPVSALKLPYFILDNYTYINKYNQSYMHRNMLYNIPNVGGVFSCLIGRYKELTTEGLTFEHNFIKNKKIANLLSVKYYIFPEDKQSNNKVPNSWYYSTDKIDFYKVKDPSLQLVSSSNGINIYENKDVLPRAVIVHKSEVIKDKEKILKRLTSIDFNPLESIILEEAIPGIRQIETPISISSRPYEYARIVEYKNNNTKIITNLLESGFLLLNDIYFPGFRVYVDNKETKLYRANYIFKAVILGKGSHTVDFVYDPSYFKIGFLITVITFSFVIILCLGRFIRIILILHGANN